MRETAELLSSWDGQCLFCQEAWKGVARALRLSPRQAEIARGVVEDLREAAIAARFGISPRTVHSHLERVYGNLGVSSRVELVVRVFRAYLVWRDRSPRPTGCPLGAGAPVDGHDGTGAAFKCQLYGRRRGGGL